MSEGLKVRGVFGPTPINKEPNESDESVGAIVPRLEYFENDRHENDDHGNPSQVKNEVKLAWTLVYAKEPNWTPDGAGSLSVTPQKGRQWVPATQPQSSGFYVQKVRKRTKVGRNKNKRPGLPDNPAIHSGERYKGVLKEALGRYTKHLSESYQWANVEDQIAQMRVLAGSPQSKASGNQVSALDTDTYKTIANTANTTPAQFNSLLHTVVSTAHSACALSDLCTKAEDLVRRSKLVRYAEQTSKAPGQTIPARPNPVQSMVSMERAPPEITEVEADVDYADSDAELYPSDPPPNSDKVRIKQHTKRYLERTGHRLLAYDPLNYQPETIREWNAHHSTLKGTMSMYWVYFNNLMIDFEPYLRTTSTGRKRLIRIVKEFRAVQNLIEYGTIDSRHELWMIMFRKGLSFHDLPNAMWEQWLMFIEVTIGLRFPLRGAELLFDGSEGGIHVVCRQTDLKCYPDTETQENDNYELVMNEKGEVVGVRGPGGMIGVLQDFNETSETTQTDGEDDPSEYLAPPTRTQSNPNGSPSCERVAMELRRVQTEPYSIQKNDYSPGIMMEAAEQDFGFHGDYPTEPKRNSSAALHIAEGYPDEDNKSNEHDVEDPLKSLSTTTDVELLYPNTKPVKDQSPSTSASASTPIRTLEQETWVLCDIAHPREFFQAKELFKVVDGKIKYDVTVSLSTGEWQHWESYIVKAYWKCCEGMRTLAWTTNVSQLVDRFDGKLMNLDEESLMTLSKGLESTLKITGNGQDVERFVEVIDVGKQEKEQNMEEAEAMTPQGSKETAVPKQNIWQKVASECKKSSAAQAKSEFHTLEVYSALGDLDDILKAEARTQEQADYYSVQSSKDGNDMTIVQEALDMCVPGRPILQSAFKEHVKDEADHPTARLATNSHGKATETDIRKGLDTKVDFKGKGKPTPVIPANKDVNSSPVNTVETIVDDNYPDIVNIDTYDVNTGTTALTIHPSMDATDLETRVSTKKKEYARRKKKAKKAKEKAVKELQKKYAVRVYPRTYIRQLQEQGSEDFFHILLKQIEIYGRDDLSGPMSSITPGINPSANRLLHSAVLPTIIETYFDTRGCVINIFESLLDRIDLIINDIEDDWDKHIEHGTATQEAQMAYEDGIELCLYSGYYVLLAQEMFLRFRKAGAKVQRDDRFCVWDCALRGKGICHKEAQFPGLSRICRRISEFREDGGVTERFATDEMQPRYHFMAIKKENQQLWRMASTVLALKVQKKDKEALWRSLCLHRSWVRIFSKMKDLVDNYETSGLSLEDFEDFTEIPPTLPSLDVKEVGNMTLHECEAALRGLDEVQEFVHAMKMKAASTKYTGIPASMQKVMEQRSEAIRQKIGDARRQLARMEPAIQAWVQEEYQIVIGRMYENIARFWPAWATRAKNQNVYSWGDSGKPEYLIEPMTGWAGYTPQYTSTESSIIKLFSWWASLRFAMREIGTLVEDCGVLPTKVNMELGKAGSTLVGSLNRNLLANIGEELITSTQGYDILLVHAAVAKRWLASAEMSGEGERAFLENEVNAVEREIRRILRKRSMRVGRMEHSPDCPQNDKVRTMDKDTLSMQGSPGSRVSVNQTANLSLNSNTIGNTDENTEEKEEVVNSTEKVWGWIETELMRKLEVMRRFESQGVHVAVEEMRKKKEALKVGERKGGCECEGVGEMNGGEGWDVHPENTEGDWVQ